MKLFAYAKGSADVQERLDEDHDVMWFDNVERLNNALRQESAVVFFDDETRSPSNDIQQGVQLIKDRRAPPDIIIVGSRNSSKRYGDNIYFIPWSAKNLYHDILTVLKRVAIKDGSEQRPDELEDEKARFYGDVAGRFDERADNVFNIRDQIEHIVSVLQTHDCSNVLDIGCGTGRVSNRLAEKGYDVTGIDIQKEYLKAAREDAPNTGVSYKHVNMLRLTSTFQEASFDASLLIWNTISDAKRNWPDLLKHVHYVLKKDGVLLLDLPDIEDLEEHVKKRGISGTKYVEEVSGTTTYRGHLPDFDLFFDMLDELNFDVSVIDIDYGRNSLAIIAEKKTGSSIFPV